MALDLTIGNVANTLSNAGVQAPVDSSTPTGAGGSTNTPSVTPPPTLPPAPAIPGSSSFVGPVAPPFTPPPTNAPIPVNQVTPNTPLNISSTVTAPATNEQANGVVAGAMATGQSYQDLVSSLTPETTPLDQSQQAILDSIASLTEKQGQKGAEQLTRETNAGIPGMQTTLQNLNNQLASEVANYNANKIAIDMQGGGVSRATAAVQQAAVDRGHAAAIGLIGAQISAAQGNLTLAQNQVNRAIDLKYSTIDSQLATAKAQLDAITPQLNKEQAIQAEARSATIAKQAADVAYQRDQAKSVAQLMVANPNAGVTPDDSLINAAAKVSSYLAHNPNVGGKPEIMGSYYDDFGNKIDIYGIMGLDGQLRPINGQNSGASTTGNANFGISTGTMLGLPTYNTQDNNPGVSRPVRNNNPMDIKATASSVNLPGVIGIESTPAADGGNFLIFDTPAHSLQAGMQMISTSGTYKGLTAEQAMRLYSGGVSTTPTAQDKTGFDTPLGKRYLNGSGYGASAVGLDPAKDFQSQLQDPNTLQSVGQNILKNEGGGSSGNINSTTGGTNSFAEYGLLANSSFDPGQTGAKPTETQSMDSLAQRYLDAYIKSGVIPTASTLGRAIKPQIMSQVQKRANDLFFEATGKPLPNPSQIKNAQGIINTNQQMANSLTIQEETVSKNVDLSLANMKKNTLNSSGFKPLDNLLNTVSDLFQNPNVGQLIAQNATIQNELGSLLAVKNATGTTVYDKLASAGIITRNDSEAVVKQKVTALLQEAGNFATSINDANAKQYRITDPLLTNPDNPLRAKYQAAVQAGYKPDEILKYLNSQ